MHILSFLCLTATIISVRAEIIEVVNNTSQTLQVQHSMPEYTKAIIELQKFGNPQELLHKGILDNNASIVEHAIKLGANVNLEKGGTLPLLLAVLLKRSKIIEILVSSGANVNSLIVQNALKFSDDKTILLLVRKSKIHLSEDNIIALISRSYGNGELKLLQELIYCNHDVNSMWQAAIMLGERAEAAINLLLQHGANPNYTAKRINGTTTPLFESINYRNKKAAEVLVNAGANVNQKAGYPMTQTPLSYAIARNHNDDRIEIIELLLKNSAIL